MDHLKLHQISSMAIAQSHSFANSHGYQVTVIAVCNGNA